MSFPITLRETFPEHWPAPLLEASLPMISLPLSLRDAQVLGSQSRSFREAMGDWRRDGFSDAFLADITEALTEFPAGVFPRIGYCSWKASMLGPRACTTLAEVMQVITADDPRIANGLAVALTSAEPVVLHLREWRDIPPWAEFRIFYRQKRVVGVSQYFWREEFPEIAAQESQIRAAIRVGLQQIWPHLPREDGVLDLALLPQEDLRAILLDMGPFTPQSDPCLYSWDRGGDFDRQLRYRRHGLVTGVDHAR